MSEQGTWFAMAALSGAGLMFFVWAMIQEHFFQKEIERQKREGTYPYPPGMGPDGRGSSKRPA